MKYVKRMLLISLCLMTIMLTACGNNTNGTGNKDTNDVVNDATDGTEYNDQNGNTNNGDTLNNNDMDNNTINNPVEGVGEGVKDTVEGVGEGVRDTAEGIENGTRDAINGTNNNNK